MYRRLHKALAFVLIFVLAFSSMGSLSAYADTDPGSNWQIKKDTNNNTIYHTLDTNGGVTGENTTVTNSTPGGKVSIQKSITPTANENNFDIALSVQTKQEVKTETISPDAAVVLVIDVSYSMRGTPLDNAKAAAKDFLYEYVSNSNGAARHVTIVAFHTKGRYIVENWTNATPLNWTQGASSNNSLTNAIGNLAVATNSDDYYTNIHHGLMLARDKVKALPTGVSAANSFVVLLTDGAPNRYMEGNTVMSASSTRNGHYTRPPIVAKEITDLGTKLYSISYGADNATIDHSGSPSLKVGPWLRSFSTLVFSSAAAGDLTLIFQSIINQIELVTKAWTVTDPMGQFIALDEASNPDIVFDPSSTNRLTFNNETKTLTWNLNGFPYTVSGTDSNKTYTYTMTYRIRLDTAAQGFVADQFYLTNGYTKLEYAYYDGTGKLMDESGKYIYNSDGSINTNSDRVTTLRTLDFKVPAVKGAIPVMNYTIEYYTENRGNLGTYTLADTSPVIPVNLWTNVNYPAGYTTKFSPTHNFFSSDPAVPMLINANNMVLKLKYNLVPTTVTVNHHYRTDTINMDGTTTRGTYGVPDVDPYSSGFYVGDRFPLSGDVELKTLDGFTLVTSDDAPNPVSDARSIASLGATGNVINLYYVKTVDLRKDASVEVYKKFYNYEWQLNSTTGLYEKVLVSTTGSTTENPVSVSGNTKIPANYTVNVFEAEYNRIELTVNGVSATANPSGDVTFALTEGVNKVVAVYEKTADPRVASNVTVNHIYTRIYTTIDGGVATTHHDPNAVIGHTENIPMFVGETFDFDESTGFRLLYNGVTYPTPGTGAGPITVDADPANNVINISYLIPDSTPKTSVTVNHYFRTWDSSIDIDTGNTIWTLISTNHTDARNYPNLFVGTTFNAPLNPEGRTGYTMDLMASESGVTSQTSMTLGNTGNVLNIYYDAKAGEPPIAGTATAIHEYYIDVLKVDNGSVITERRKVDAETFTELKHGATDSSFTFAERLESNGHTYTRFDTTSSLEVPFNGSSITLKYFREGPSELIPTTLDVTHNYFSRTMTVTNGVAGYEDPVQDGSSLEFVVRDKNGVILNPATDLYVGMQVTVELAPVFNENTYIPRGTNPSLTIILGPGALQPMNLNPVITNSLVLNYDRDIPLPQVDIIVNHTYHETVFTYPGGVETSTVDTTLGATNGMVAATKYVGEHYTAAAAPGDFTLTSAEHGGSDITPTGGEYVITVAATGNVVDFVYEKTTGRRAPAAVTVRHFYTEVDFDGTKTGYEANPSTYVPDVVTASSFAGMPFTATPILKADEGGLNGYTLTGQDATPDFVSGLTITLAAGDENVINLYYTRSIDTRMQTAVTVNHFYSVFDTYTSIRTSEGEHNEIFSSFEDGVWVGATFNAVPRTGHNDRTYVLDTDISDPLSLILLQIGEETSNVINLYYQRTVDSTPPFNPPVTPVLDQYTIRVSYRELGTDNELAPDNVTTLFEFSSYDVTAATSLEIEGFVIDSVTGDPATGVLRGNRTLTVWYTAIEDEVIIEDDDVPLAEEPDEPEVEIEEETTPLGDAPDTSDTSNLALMIAMGVFSLGGLTFLFVDNKRRITDK